MSRETRMTHPDPIWSALAAINTETMRAFDWLIEGLDRRAPVTFVPNPGNIGDAAINLACFDYLAERFDELEICSMADTPRTEYVFVGGGGNAIEPLYNDVRNFLDRLSLDHRLLLFPSTIQGYSESLRRIAPIARILCRESISYAHVANHLSPENVMLTHDAAFLLVRRLWNDFSKQIGRSTPAKCRSFRTDEESLYCELGGNDIMAEHRDAWTDMSVARDAVWSVVNYLLDFGEVETDRLHCAILASMIGRRTVLRANSYYKNGAVFDHSLSRLPNTAFLPSTIDLRAKNAGRRILRGIRRFALVLSP
jgi:exopolysaccharide biosynthesis predicted pyruvyltransferase EpsI